jgi:cobalt/nickel transport system permease protein
MSSPAVFDHRHLHVHGTSPIHRIAPEAKLLGLLGFVITVAITPRQWVLAFAIDATVLLGVFVTARLTPQVVLGRLAAILPFVTFAFLLPFIGDGETTSVLGVSLSIDGLWASWNVLAKATLGGAASIALTATTPIPELLTGLSRLRVPAAIIAIIGFMFRYLDLMVDEIGRMRRAMAARAYNPRWLWQSRPLASSAGALFVRTYERGERVHDAMAARGFTGTMPTFSEASTTRNDWLLAAVPAVVSLVGLTIVGLT